MDANTLFRRWADVQQGLYQALDCLADAQLDFTPRPGLWSLRKTVIHIAGTEDGWLRYCAFHVTENWPEDPPDDQFPTVASLKALLEMNHSRSMAFFAEDPETVLAREVTLPWGPVVTIEWIVWHILEHEIHHRGEVYLMLGLQGLEAPDV